MKALLTVIAVLEITTGLVLLLSPSLVARVLLGASLDTLPALVVGRVAGAALLALGIACWLARDDRQSRAGRGLVVGMLLYNAAVVALLVHVRVGAGLSGSGLWLAVGAHTVLAAWCVECLRRLNSSGNGL